VEKDLDLLRYAARAYAVIGAWCKAGVFETLLNREAHAFEALPGNSRALRQSASILAHTGLVVLRNDTVALSKSGYDLYNSGSLNIVSSEAAVGDMSRLDAVLMDGGPARDKDGNSRVTEGGVREHDPESARNFMDMLFRRSANSAAEVGRWLKASLPEGGHVLDLGGGHGRYADEIVKNGFSVTLYDRPICVEIAQERFGTKLSYMTGDFFCDDLGGPYNAALLSNIVHGLGPEENLSLFRRLREVMAPGGQLLLKDMFIGEHRAHPEEAVFFDLTMLMYTREGRSYTLEQIQSLYEEAGFVHHDHIYVRDQSFSLLVARK
jgi:2-polyprenyl-3-methyl-5-hydroxy-6-metoxy-1,4-benzoquinol methylase